MAYTSSVSIPANKPAGTSWGETSRDCGYKPNPKSQEVSQQHHNQMGDAIAPKVPKTK